MAVVNAFGKSTYPNVGNLQTAQTGNADSTNTVDTGSSLVATLKIVSTVGGSPTVTVNIQGSVDGTNFFNVPYSTTAAPSTWVLTALTITTAVTSHYYLQPNYGWRYLKLVMSANTNVTLTSDLYVF